MLLYQVGIDCCRDIFISTLFIYLFIYLSIYLFIDLFIYLLNTTVYPLSTHRNIQKQDIGSRREKSEWNCPPEK